MLAIFWVNYSACQPDLSWQEAKKETHRDREKGGKRMFTKKEKVRILNLLQMNLLSKHPGQQHTQNSSCHSLGSAGFHVNNSAENQVLNAIHKFFWCFVEERKSLGGACQVYDDFLFLSKASSKYSLIFSFLTSHGPTSLSFVRLCLRNTGHF